MSHAHNMVPGHLNHHIFGPTGWAWEVQQVGCVWHNLAINGCPALRLATHRGHEAIVALLLEVPRIDAAAGSATDGSTARDIAVARDHVGIVRLLKEFESRLGQARSSSLDLTLHPGQLTPEESVGDEAGSGSSEAYQDAEEWLAGDYVMAVEGADDALTQDEPSGSRPDAKRPRGDEDDGLQHSGDDIAAPTPKRQRVLEWLQRMHDA
ncbi:hypothetical protein BKA70DRAFT_1574017 [Coprinopsis sp. MPI-PUGE-AT-0042]|nr:hypothetical protein BKA70DRAFT_1574017 [Coprinopsis sp. MPI-PUGE-AT-0042]